MAYLHCHACDWSQDDFWSIAYNPITKFWDDFKWLWRPRILELDDWIVNDISALTWIPIKRFGGQRGQLRVFSWNWLLIELAKEWYLFRRQKWWTWKSWNRKRDNAVCPKCGQRAFDID